ncbi:Bromodomain-containing protein [Macrolepiota fuliginosa MF-IS2]|uniref:Bromodomain-containing protein n=1 Tax=Macrolepiota fuliginosa MF-IS2 TaxID=1400762 RepID=A0A9P5XNU3_9AGAR|nr:Bromodomain-containing protein [Macrolepiota fuliginosa MF-IS2]
MSKRELSRLVGTADVEGSRPKRRRDAASLPNSSPDADVIMAEPAMEAAWQNGISRHVGGQSVKEQGLQLWLTIKEAKSKDGRLLAAVFLTKPPRKIYPDYYQIIQRPIALDDIKKRLDTNVYSSMQAVRADFELLFNNALEYNMKDSIIWKDAKDMLRLVHKTCEKLAPMANDDDDESDEEEKKGKSKTPNLSRMIKLRLQKLIEKTDRDGRVMSTEFMQLPNKKQWAIYYRQIKKPQCLENIFRRIKRKEYHTAATFAADVELVFSNAMSFNQDHTLIWEDALALRDYFRLLMSDLPPPHNLPEYSTKAITNKIKIKPPAAPSNVPSDSAVSKSEPSSSSLLLRVPAVSAAAKLSQPTAASPAAKAKPSAPSTIPAVVSAPNASTAAAMIAPTKSPVAPQPQLPAQRPPAVVTQPVTKSTSATPQPAATVQQTTFSYSHYSHPYQPVPPSIPAPSVTPAVAPVKLAPAASNSPAPTPIHPNHQIRFVKVRVQPQGRLFWLDHREGVRTWAIRLAPGETGVNVDDLVFVGDEEAEDSSDDEDDEDLKLEEEEDMEVDGSTSPTKSGRIRKGKAAVRRSQRTAAVTTRTTRSAAAVAKNKIQEKREIEKVEEVELKLNGAVVKEKEDMTRQWNVGLPFGPNILEVGEKGGLMWKVYIERIAD